MSAGQLVCAGCGTSAPPFDVEPYPFRCRCAGAAPNTDHVMAKAIDARVAAWPPDAGGEVWLVGPPDLNPFVRYSQLLYSAQIAHEEKLELVALIERLDDAIAAVDGRGFRVTPFGRSEALSGALGFSARGGAWIKDETGNVSGSHKARHLAGLMLYLLVLERAGRVSERPELAIASCGNAALAAAVVARAAGWTLRTFIPPGADVRVVQRLRELGAALVICPRRRGEAGDPCYLRFREALAAGAIPFCCQGPDNGLTIEGGETLVYEIADALGNTDLDALVVQVGGGALASA